MGMTVCLALVSLGPEEKTGEAELPLDCDRHMIYIPGLWVLINITAYSSLSSVNLVFFFNNIIYLFLF